MVLKVQESNDRPHRNLGLPALLLAALTLLASAGAIGQNMKRDRLDALFDDEATPWQEIAVRLPPAPQAANLLPFEVSNTTTQRFALDEKSFTAGTDGVVRYTLVAISSSGARNISYEGIRCATDERKLYALGQSDGSWTRARRDKWTPIVNDAMNRPQAALAQDYFCRGGGVAGKPDRLIERLRRHEIFNKEFLN